MLEIHIEIVGLRDLRGRFARYEQQLNRYRREELSLFAKDFVKILKQKAPIDKRKREGSGEFRKSFSPRITRRGNWTTLNFVSSDPRAKYILYPTKSHEIVPIRKKVLKWVVGGTKHYSKRVMHPGTKGTDFAERAVIKGGDDFIRSMNRAGARATIYLAGKGVI